MRAPGAAAAGQRALRELSVRHGLRSSSSRSSRSPAQALAARFQRDDDAGSSLAILGAARGVEVDEPDLEAPRDAHQVQSACCASSSNTSGTSSASSPVGDMRSKAPAQPVRTRRTGERTMTPFSTRSSSSPSSSHSLITEAGMRMPFYLPMRISSTFMGALPGASIRGNCSRRRRSRKWRPSRREVLGDVLVPGGTSRRLSWLRVSDWTLHRLPLDDLGRNVAPPNHAGEQYRTP